METKQEPVVVRHVPVLEYLWGTNLAHCRVAPIGNVVWLSALFGQGLARVQPGCHLPLHILQFHVEVPIKDQGVFGEVCL
jgi:hypothetical protein